MDAMILAAGLGTRLGDLTQDTPKALIDVGGVPVLERVARRLIAAGADHIIINVHHHADRIIEFVRSRDDFGVAVSISHEEDAPLETGGGLLHAKPLFRGEGSFFVHNVDVLCDVDLRAMHTAHVHSGALATLAVSRRDTSRYLLFDETGLCGRMHAQGGGPAEVHADCADPVPFAFAGIHVISPALLDMITETGAFSIIDLYLRLASIGRPIAKFDIGGARWLEIGNPERLADARRAFG
ncbi:MAG TPA: nucleotidyltransferase family protein [Longimicrobiales bacterium]|nr:nucleotidyltransferase family protein [Longimicrobiales bacterium]